ncbi:MAG: membrane protein insertion efficiency factor YidD [Actinomycetota bacterium]
MGVIHVYRRTLSGLLGGQCRFFPSCSHYAEQAIREHGAVRGSLLAVWRIARCGPFTRGGVDPVPPAGRGAPSYHGVYDGVTPASEYDAVTRARSNRGSRRGAHAQRNSREGAKA